MTDPSPALQAPLAEGRVAQIFEWEPGRVLKLSRGWVPPEWLKSEFEVAKTVHASGMPSPEPLALLEIEGRTGIVYERVDGPTMLSRLAAAPLKVARFAREMAGIHLKMHALEAPESLRGVRTHLERKIRAVKGAPEIIRRAALARLETLPAESPRQLLHGDFHPDNILMSAQGPMAIDWPDASAGHPLADVARTYILLRIGALPPGLVLRVLVGLLRGTFVRSYLQTYFAGSPYRREDLDAWLLPVLFGRLSEDIQEERAGTVRWLEDLAARGTR